MAGIEALRDPFWNRSKKKEGNGSLRVNLGITIEWPRGGLKGKEAEGKKALSYRYCLGSTPYFLTL